MNEHKEEKQEQGHAPEPGYRTAFYIFFLVTTLYLVIIFAIG